MDMNKEQYKQYAKAHAPKSPVVKDTVKAFLFGGAICVLSQGLRMLYLYLWEIETSVASALASSTLAIIAIALTAIGVFDNIAKHAGAGTLVPITGFANAVVSPAIEFKDELKVDHRELIIGLTQLDKTRSSIDTGILVCPGLPTFTVNS